jgi:hypothetical protein
VADLLPDAMAWAAAISLTAQKNGVALNPRWVQLAEAVGVQQPEKIRIYAVQEIPRPGNVELAKKAAQVGLLGPTVRGLTLGYSVIVLGVHQNNPRFLAHEFRHVYQYEMAGSLEGFLREYLQQVITYGYWNSVLECDARDHEDASLQIINCD